MIVPDTTVSDKVVDLLVVNNFVPGNVTVPDDGADNVVK